LKHLPRGRPLGSGLIPACDDTNGAIRVGRGERVRIRALRGVDPRLAIVVETRPRALYVNGRERNSRDALALVRRLRHRA
jgi:hypothetical protein